MMKCTACCRKVLRELLRLTLLISVSGYAFAEPQITQVSLVDSEKVTQAAKVRIAGMNFGTKENAAPVLIDYVDEAFEYGKQNDVNSRLDDMSSIPTGLDGDAGAVWATSTDDFRYTTEGQHRHSRAEASYYFKGENNWVGRPVSYGGASGWETPVDNPQLYLSWWYKNKFNSTYYWRFSPNEQSGNFKVGEELVIEGQKAGQDRGVYVGIDGDGLHNAVLYGHRNQNYLTGAGIKGVNSGARTVFPDTFRGGSGYGYETLGSKLVRVWDYPERGAGIAASVALHNAYVSSSGFPRSTMYYMLDLPGGEWVHLEYELDVEKGVFRLYEDGRLLGEQSFSPEAAYQGKYSPTVALLGTNAKQLKLQESWISEIYIDSSFQRVVIGNAPRYEDVTHKELQRPTAWSKDEIEVALHLGSLGFNQDLYVYVIDRDGVPNSIGAPLCTGNECPVPPTRIDLKVD